MGSHWDLNFEVPFAFKDAEVLDCLTCSTSVGSDFDVALSLDAIELLLACAFDVREDLSFQAEQTNHSSDCY